VTSARAVVLVFVAIAGWAQQRVVIHVDDARPLGAAIGKLQDQARIAINYEDAPIQFAGDMVDVTDRVQNPQQRAANPNHRIRIPRGGRLSITATVSPGRESMDVQNALSRLIEAHAAAGYPGSYVLDTKTAIPRVAPSAVRDERGRTVPVQSVLNKVIELPYQERNAYELLKLILEQVGKDQPFKIGVATAPWQMFASRNVTSGGVAGQTAAEAIDQLFVELSRNGPNDPRTTSRMSYQLNYDPGIRWYALNVATVRWVPPPFVPLPPATAVGGKLGQGSNKP
jgi:hypothetical protein